MDFILNADKELLLLINGLHTSFLDGFMWQMSNSRIWIPLYLAIIFLIFKKFNFRTASYLFFFLLVSVSASDWISVHLFKEVFDRLRPSHSPDLVGLLHLHQEAHGEFYKGGLYGFVSSHAANSFSLALFSSLIFQNKIYTWSIFVWAFTVSYSRIYWGVHYPTDIFGGALLGIFISVFFFKLFLFFKNKWIYLKISFPPEKNTIRSFENK